MALKDWKKEKVKSGYIFTGKTDFNTGRKYQETDIYIYKKGWFRNRENYVVVKINYKRNHLKDEFHNFDSIKRAMKFATSYMKKH